MALIGDSPDSRLPPNNAVPEQHQRFITTINAFPTARSPVGSDGLFTTAPPITIVVDPPPSRFTASYTPSWIIVFASSTSDIPESDSLRPSTVTR